MYRKPPCKKYNARRFKQKSSIIIDVPKVRKQFVCW